MHSAKTVCKPVNNATLPPPDRSWHVADADALECESQPGFGLGVDALAIAIGTSHGAYKFTRKPIGDIKETYGVPVEEIQRGIQSGVRKINIDTDIRLTMAGAMRQIFAQQPSSPATQQPSNPASSTRARPWWRPRMRRAASSRPVLKPLAAPGRAGQQDQAGGVGGDSETLR